MSDKDKMKNCEDSFDDEKKKFKHCDCDDDCDCGDNCECDDHCDCGEHCDCKDDDDEWKKKKHKYRNDEDDDDDDEENHKGHHKCQCHHEHDHSNKAQEYLTLAQQIKADFENYRRHAIEDIKNAKIDGQVSVIEAFLPCLDTFKEAKKSINDENILTGINMIEDKIKNTLSSLGVEKVETIGQVYDPHKHEAIASFKDDKKENNVILDEYQAGYMFNGKIIRYAKVIVNKKD